MRNKLIAAGLGLVGYGALVGWAVTADYYENKMRGNQRVLGDVINRQRRELDNARALLLDDSMIEENKHGNDETILGDPEGADELVGGIDADDDVVGDDSESADESDEDVDEAETEKVRAKLQSQINQYTSNEDGVNHLLEMGRTFEDDNTPPFVITRAQYSWDEEEGDDYEKITLTYYPRDRILLDDEDDQIEDVANMVGWRNLARFGDESGDADVVFIRNRRLETDFEVVRDTENQVPAHIRYGLSREEFETGKASGMIRFRPGDV